MSPELITCITILIVFSIATIVYNYTFKPKFDAALAMDQDITPSVEWKKSLYIKGGEVFHFYECIDGNYKIRYFEFGYFYLEIYTLDDIKIVKRVMFGRDYYYRKDMENPGLRKECLEEARRVIDIYENPCKNIE